jgi:Domain of unknown function (DUF6948)
MPGVGIQLWLPVKPKEFFSMASVAKKTERPVIVCTSHRGVFFGFTEDTSGDIIHLKRARMAIYWGTTRGVMELAEVGPTAKSKISAQADIEVRSITAIFEVSPTALDAWKGVK